MLIYSTKRALHPAKEIKLSESNRSSKSKDRASFFYGTMLWLSFMGKEVFPYPIPLV